VPKREGEESDIRLENFREDLRGLEEIFLAE